MANFYKFILKKDAYGKYVSFTTLGSYIAGFGAKVFKFLWRVIFGGRWAEPKLVSAHPQIPLWFEKYVMMWNSNFCKIIVHFDTVLSETSFYYRDQDRDFWKPSLDIETGIETFENLVLISRLVSRLLELQS